MPTVSVPPGAFNITISGAFSSSYQVFVSANWPTELPVVNKTPTSFDINPFTMLAPVGAEIDYFVTGGTSPLPGTGSTLATYRDEVRRLLRDKTTTGAQVIWTDNDLDAFINRAMQQRDLDLGLNRTLIRYTLTAGIFRYPFATIVAGGTVIDGLSSGNLMDVLSVTVYPIGGATPTGGIKYMVSRRAYSFVASLTSTSFPTYPAWYAIFGPNVIYLAPPPANAYITEFDFKSWPTPLVNDTDADPMPYPYTDPVPFAAVGFAKLEAQRFDEADVYLNMDPRKPLGLYQQRLNLVRSGSRPFAVREPMFDLPGRW